MAVDIGPKIGIEGEREFRQQIAQTNQALKTLAAEGKAVSSAFNDEADAQKKSAAQMDVLNRQIETQKDKVALLEKGLMDSAKMYGEADVRTMKWQQALHEATASLNTMESELRGMDGTVEDTSDAMEDAGNATKGWADVMKGSLLADATKAGLKELVKLATKAASAFWDASNAGAAYADDMLTMSTVTGLSTDELQKYAYAAEFVDVSLDTITGSLTKLTKSMDKARKGEGDAADVFAELGVAVVDTNGKLRSANDVFNDALEALGGIDNETERDAKAMTLFGKSAKELNPLIAAGSEKLEKLGKAAETTGYVLSGSALSALGAQHDAMDRLDKKVEALKNRFAVKLAPAMTKVFDSITKILDDPRVQRGLDVIANGFGKIIEKGAALAEKVLPKVFEAFNLGDTRLMTFTDAQMRLAEEADNLAESYSEWMDAYTAGAVAIIEQTKHTEGLWKELQTLADESGRVDESNRARAEFILGELNSALGTEYSMNEGIIGQYQQMKQEIGDIMAQRTAEALLTAGEDDYREAIESQSAALATAGASLLQVTEAEGKLERATANAMEAWRKYAESDFTDTTWKEAYDDADDSVQTLRKQLFGPDGLIEAWDKAQKAADGYVGTIVRFEQAQAAASQGNYREAMRLLTDEMGATVAFYEQKAELDREQRDRLRQYLYDLDNQIAAYKDGLRRGLTVYTEEGLAQLEDYRRQAERILNGEDVAEEWMNGLIRGLGNTAKLREVGQTAEMAADQIVRTSRTTLSIKSPSRVAAWIGEMWDQGLIKGLKDSEDLVAKTASGLADTITTAGTPDSAEAYQFGNDWTASGGGLTTSSASYTTNLGGITVRIEGAGEVDEDVLAARVAARLTDELIRAQRGGRL